MPSERRRSQRAAIAVPCRLERRAGSPIDGRTIDIGTGGMCVETSRPLATDELLRFEIALTGAGPVQGQARVLRQQGFKHYALRFERISEEPLEQLKALVSG
jgi:c-di-GMP-binding flagellar brake protein YcgR